MNLTRYRPRISGPEAQIEDAVASNLQTLFNTDPTTCWAAASMPIGAGMPDLALVRFEPHVLAVTKTDIGDAEILGYLRGVRSARSSTIAARTGKPLRAIIRLLDGLVDANVVTPVGQAFAMCDTWRDVLPEIVTIEAKVGNWQAAAGQALRNSIFAHRSYVALPVKVATRVKDEPQFIKAGIGILSVTGSEVEEIRAPRYRQPRVWSYYYRVALEVAEHFVISGKTNGIQGRNRRRAS